MSRPVRARARGWAALLTSVVVLSMATGCGEDDPFAIYCEEVQAQQKPITEALAAQGPTALLDALPSFEALQEVAPDDLTDEWSTVTRRISVLDEALAGAGVDPTTFDREDPPAGLSKEEQAEIDAAARELVSPAMMSALAGVQQQARDVCKTPLGL